MIRVITSFLSVALIYALIVFVCLEPNLLLWRVEGRAIFAAVSLFVFVGVYGASYWNERK